MSINSGWGCGPGVGYYTVVRRNELSLQTTWPKLTSQLSEGGCYFQPTKAAISFEVWMEVILAQEEQKGVVGTACVII